MKRFSEVKKVLALFAVLLLPLGFFTGCEGEEIPAMEGKESESRQTEAIAAIPAIGVGREMPDPVIPKDFTVCIDPGHGYMDGGTGEGYFPDGILEKDINLAISNLLSGKLTEMGFQTILTHDGVHTPSGDTNNNKVFNPGERVAYVNQLDVDYFISLHVNALPSSPSTEGIILFYINSAAKADESSAIITETIAGAIEAALPNDPIPDVREQALKESFAVVRDTKAPATLIEVGFCTNANDVQRMTDPAWQENLAEAIAKGILQYYEQHGDGS